MTETYTTRQGDTFDGIAYLAYGTSGVTGRLIAANPDYSGVYVFDAGTKLILPAISVSEATEYPIAPWIGGAIG